MEEDEGGQRSRKMKQSSSKRHPTNPRFNQIIALEKKLSMLSKTKNSSYDAAECLRSTIRNKYESLILENTSDNEALEIEQALWRLHYRKIDEFRTQIRTISALHRGGSNVDQHALLQTLDAFKEFLADATNFYLRLIEKLRQNFGLSWDPLTEVGSNTFNAHSNQSFNVLDGKDGNLRDLQQCQVSCYRCLLYLGDLARYQQLYGVLGSQERNWSTAAMYYRQAAAMWRSSGNPHNQLAVLATYVSDELLAVYYYIRSLSVENPFITAKENLRLLFQKNQQRFEQFWSSSGLSEKAEHHFPEDLFGYGDFSDSTKILCWQQTMSELLQLPSDKEEIQKQFQLCYVRLIGIVFTKTCFGEVDKILSVALYLLLTLLSHSAIDVNMGSRKDSLSLSKLIQLGESGILHIIAVLIFSIDHSNLDDGHDLGSLSESAQMPDPLQYALCISEKFVSLLCFLRSCSKSTLHLVCPAITIFLVWLANHTCLLMRIKADSFIQKIISSLSQQAEETLIVLGNLNFNTEHVNDISQETAVVEKGSIRNSDHANLALWEDQELQGFSPLSSVHSKLTFSKVLFPPELGQAEIFTIRYQRLGSALKEIKNFLFGKSSPVSEAVMGANLPETDAKLLLKDNPSRPLPESNAVMNNTLLGANAELAFVDGSTLQSFHSSIALTSNASPERIDELISKDNLNEKLACGSDFMWKDTLPETNVEPVVKDNEKGIPSRSPDSLMIAGSLVSEDNLCKQPLHCPRAVMTASLPELRAELAVNSNLSGRSMPRSDSVTDTKVQETNEDFGLKDRPKRNSSTNSDALMITSSLETNAELVSKENLHCLEAIVTTSLPEKNAEVVDISSLRERSVLGSDVVTNTTLPEMNEELVLESSPNRNSSHSADGRMITSSLDINAGLVFTDDLSRKILHKPEAVITTTLPELNAGLVLKSNLSERSAPSSDAVTHTTWPEMNEELTLKNYPKGNLSHRSDALIVASSLETDAELDPTISLSRRPVHYPEAIMTFILPERNTEVVVKSNLSGRSAPSSDALTNTTSPETNEEQAFRDDETKESSHKSDAVLIHKLPDLIIELTFEANSRKTSSDIPNSMINPTLSKINAELVLEDSPKRKSSSESEAMMNELVLVKSKLGGQPPSEALSLEEWKGDSCSLSHVQNQASLPGLRCTSAFHSCTESDSHEKKSSACRHTTSCLQKKRPRPADNFISPPSLKRCRPFMQDPATLSAKIPNKATLPPPPPSLLTELRTSSTAFQQQHTFKDILQETIHWQSQSFLRKELHSLSGQQSATRLLNRENGANAGAHCAFTRRSGACGNSMSLEMESDQEPQQVRLHSLGTPSYREQFWNHPRPKSSSDRAFKIHERASQDLYWLDSYTHVKPACLHHVLTANSPDDFRTPKPNKVSNKGISKVEKTWAIMTPHHTQLLSTQNPFVMLQDNQVTSSLHIPRHISTSIGSFLNCW